MDSISVINDLLREELKKYYSYLKDKLGYVSTLDDLLNIENDELIDDQLDGDSEIIYDMLNEYINVNPDEEFDVKVNNNIYSSIQLKLLILTRTYEYGLYHYDMLTNDEESVLRLLSKNPNIQMGLKLYDENYRIILNLYSSIVLDTFDIKTLKECRKHIIDDNRLNIIADICPYAMFDYRFFLGYRFEN